jgi:hypothetical protein
MTPQKLRRTKIFISYNHQDAVWLERLQVHLRPLERDFGADVWDDTKIQSGSRWREEIEQALESAAVAILLISADFLGSDFIARNELPPLLKAAEEEGTVILPIILSHSGFLRHEALSQFQAFNDPSKPVLNMSRGRQEAVLEKVAERVAGLLGASASTVKRKAKAGKLEKTKRFASKGQTERGRADISWTQNEGNTVNSPGSVEVNIPDVRQLSAQKEHRTISRLVIAAIALGVLAISILIAIKQFGNRAVGTTSVNKPDLARTDAAPTHTDQVEVQARAYRIVVGRGSMAIAFDNGHDSLRIQLDEIKVDKGSNQPLVSFRLLSANSEVLEVTDGIVSGERIYTYPANGKFKIKVLSADENLADFLIEEMVN